MRFSKLSFYFNEIENTDSRIAITHLLAELIKNLNVNEIDKTIYLLQGRVVPLYEKIKFGIAEKTVIKASLMAMNLEKGYFLSQYKKIGDIGATVEFFKKQYPSFDQKDLTIDEVYKQLYFLAVSCGQGSQEKKNQILANLIRQLDPLSTRFLVRIPLGIMRLGFSAMTILDAFSWFLTGSKNLRPVVEKAYQVLPDLGLIGKLVKKKSIKEIENIKPKIFVPILMMKAERAPSSILIIEKVKQCAIEPKLDGFRLQVHYKKNEKTKLFSRGLEDVTFMYPDIVKGVEEQILADEAIFEGEAIGFDREKHIFLPFQETVQRKRKYQIREKAEQIPLKLFVFDLLLLNNENLIYSSFKERRNRLKKIVKENKIFSDNTVIVVKETLADSAKQIDKLFNQAISDNFEGVIAKKLDGVYQPGARGWNWIKLKKTSFSKIEDTIDCLVMGYDFGKGKRTGFGIGAFLVGVYDKKNNKYLTLAKIGTGLSDKEWIELEKRASRLKSKVKSKQYQVDRNMDVDVWLVPGIMVEIRADEISRSPVHTAGRKMKRTKTGKGLEVDISGYALRFPRLERFRDDKNIEDITTLDEIKKMYIEQSSK